MAEISEKVTAAEAIAAFRWWHIDAPDAHGEERHVVRRFLERAVELERKAAALDKIAICLERNARFEIIRRSIEESVPDIWLRMRSSDSGNYRDHTASGTTLLEAIEAIPEEKEND
jgi:hypothetical protein